MLCKLIEEAYINHMRARQAQELHEFDISDTFGSNGNADGAQNKLLKTLVDKDIELANAHNDNAHHILANNDAIGLNKLLIKNNSDLANTNSDAIDGLQNSMIKNNLITGGMLGYGMVNLGNKIYDKYKNSKQPQSIQQPIQ